MAVSGASGERITGDGIVMILGITPRSGTNYLRELLTLHSDCKAVMESEVNEDYFIHHSHLLCSYAEKVHESWRKGWVCKIDPLEIFGQAITRFLRGDCDVRYRVVKTPSVEGLANVSRLMPKTKLIVLVRDVRDVIESTRLSKFLSLDFEGCLHTWISRGQEILRFKEETVSSGDWPWLLVRYEDLVNDTEASILRILDFLELSASGYAFDKLATLEVRGSCELAALEGRVDWVKRPKKPDFAPVGRWRKAEWSEAERARIEQMAGTLMRDFGYDLSW